MKRNLFFIIVSAAIALTSCTELSFTELSLMPNASITPDEELTVTNGGIIDRIFNHKTPKKSMIQLDSNEVHYTAQGNVFATELFHTLCKDHQYMNLCISPLSLQVGQTILANGMNDEACRERINLLLKEDIPLANLNTFYKKMRDGMEESGSVAFVDALWAQEGYLINPSFIETCKQFYDAEVGYLDFCDASASDSINQWAYDHTNGKFYDIYLPNTTKLFLANAIYFGANWDRPFIVDSTMTTTFHPTFAQEDIDVNMMYQRDQLYYCIKPDYRMITLPFKFNSFSFIIAQPTNGESVVDMLPNVDWNCTGLALSSDSCTDGWHRGYVHLGIPKFKFRNIYFHSSNLYKVGSQELFLNGAHNGIYDESIILQDTYSSINEEGCEFAAISWLTQNTANIDSEEPSPQPYEFILDHPFVFAIRENSTGTLLFLGKVDRP